MSKKSKRQSGRRMPTYASSQQSVSSEFNPDYTAVKRDLRRIGILAGTFFAILVGLSFFLR